LTELEKIEKLQNSWGVVDAPLWLHMLGYADCEAEKVLLKKEIELKLGKCDADRCGYTNESNTAICSRLNCPLMTDKSPFNFPFSNGRRPIIESERVQETMDETISKTVSNEESRQEKEER